MNTKSIIVFGLVTAIVSAALVFDAMSHRHTANSNQAIEQNPVTNAAASPNSSNPGTEVQPTEDQSTAPAADSTTATDAGQDPAPDAAAQAQSDPDASAEARAQPAADADASQPAAPQPIFVPAGTTLTVRLGEALGSRISEVGQSFSATLDQDVVVGGQTVMPQALVSRAKSCPPDPLERWRVRPICNSSSPRSRSTTPIWVWRLPYGVLAPRSKARTRWADS